MQESVNALEIGGIVRLFSVIIREPSLSKA